MAEIEFLPETSAETNKLSDDLKKEVVRVVLELKDNPHTGEPMGDKWPKNLRGSRKVRFDLPNREGRPRYRLIYRNQPEEGAVATVVVLAIGERDRMIAYARASKRLTARIAEGGLPDTT